MRGRRDRPRRRPGRIHGCFVSENEVKDLAAALQQQGPPKFDETLLRLKEESEQKDDRGRKGTFQLGPLDPTLATLAQETPSNNSTAMTRSATKKPSGLPMVGVPEPECASPTTAIVCVKTLIAPPTEGLALFHTPCTAKVRSASGNRQGVPDADRTLAMAQRWIRHLPAE